MPLTYLRNQSTSYKPLINISKWLILHNWSDNFELVALISWRKPAERLLWGCWSWRCLWLHAGTCNTARYGYHREHHQEAALPVLSKVDANQSGPYRTIQVYNSGAEYIPPSPEELPRLMKHLAEWLYQCPICRQALKWYGAVIQNEF